MPPPSRMQPYIPDLSPTFSPATSQPDAPPTQSVRRNLFSAHLSRRPGPSSLLSQSQSQSFTHDTSSASRPQLPHQSHSQPNPTLSPASTSPFASVPPQLHPTRITDNDIYDPTVSPNHPLSPNSSAQYFPGTSIIALHPITGRPMLPTLPTLPGKLRLSEDEDEEESHSPSHDGQPAHGLRHAIGAMSKSHHYASPTPANLSLPVSTYPLPNTDDEGLDEERAERERLDRLLTDMMSRHRARVKGKEAGAMAAANSRNALGSARNVKSRRRREAPRISQDEDAEEEEEAREREELMGLIMAKLRQEVGRAEEESWMFGELGTGVGSGVGGGLGREEVGVYE